LKNKNIKVILAVLLVISIATAGYIRNTYHRSAEVFSTNSERSEHKGFKTAEFIKFNGNDYFDLNDNNIEYMRYQYFYEVTQGYIEIIKYVNNRRVWSSGKLRGKGSGAGYDRRNSGDKIKIRIIGKNADGKFTFEWDSKDPMLLVP
jgi:hypothetical protein